MPLPNASKTIKLGFLLAVLLCGLLWYSTSKPPSQSGAEHPVQASTSDPQHSSPKTSVFQNPPREPSGLELVLAEFLERLRSGNIPPDEMLLSFQQLKAQLLRADPQKVIPVLVAFLDSGVDAQTGLPFTPGEGGLLSAPSFRVFLLDVLGAIEPSAAVCYAERMVFPGMTSAAEYAISLRNLWWNDPSLQKSGELKRRFEQMWQKSEWLNQADPGLLEAFDVIPLAIEPREAFSILNQCFERGGALQEAAVLALERLAVNDPRTLLNALNTFALAGHLRAELFARADLRDPVQQKALQLYVSKLGAGTEEADRFFKSFPNHNYSLSAGLFQQPKIPDASDLAAMDMAARDCFERWQGQSELAIHAAPIATLLERLNENARNIKAAAPEPSRSDPGIGRRESVKDPQAPPVVH